MNTSYQARSEIDVDPSRVPTLFSVALRDNRTCVALVILLVYHSRMFALALVPSPSLTTTREQVITLDQEVLRLLYLALVYY